MKKQITLLAMVGIVSVLPISTYGGDYWESSVYLADGGLLKLKVDSRLKFEVSGKSIRIATSASEDEGVYELSEIDKMTYSFTGDSSVETLETMPTVEINGNEIVISSTAGEGCMMVCDMRGETLLEKVFADRIAIDIADYRPGIYLVSVNRSFTIKILKR